MYLKTKLYPLFKRSVLGENGCGKKGRGKKGRRIKALTHDCFFFCVKYPIEHALKLKGVPRAESPDWNFGAEGPNERVRRGGEANDKHS